MALKHEGITCVIKTYPEGTMNLKPRFLDISFQTCNQNMNIMVALDNKGETAKPGGNLT